MWPWGLRDGGRKRRTGEERLGEADLTESGEIGTGEHSWVSHSLGWVAE